MANASRRYRWTYGTRITGDTQAFPRCANKLSGELRRMQPILRHQDATFHHSSEGKSGKPFIELKSAQFDRRCRQHRLAQSQRGF